MLKKTSIVIVAVTIIVVTFFLYGNSNRDYKALGSQLKVSHIIYNPNKPLPSFSLVDQDNQLFNNDNLKDGWTLLLFIYTHCPDVCPTELLDMSTLKKLMLKDKAISTPKVVAITFDPLRDTPEVLKEYVRHFDKDFIGVSGEQAQINQLIKPFGAYYERVIYDEEGKSVILKANDKLPESALQDGYVINHTAWIYLINPEGQIFAGFPSPHNPSKMVDDIKLIMNQF
ncbi:Cytochrome oxidase biogenesis protein Sco1/SenC/PrrC, putative copper metallochaperone [uncultured Gammaproteobacteria bacterium]|jgi:protein SCO1/2|nr:Cytochrome oxidase biogenesis protein Sco1/SenC/PrrC, thiol-disulfide reductase involved in Cu(I) insertion into CoxII Cu(A) center [uncultured Gammaproteobacteria bacterium]CAC9469301.1 Cytochrome oxidase biogenesis protein Sco1/SenC/PrrC, thiol-disulfide reductase involved in Cu(I) insertion into CoxII Cu(A) center [uncultured Gammaproteobacteria bacterium]VVH65842.1 Cytochrome oxidase biogenesis protein Sco1/SenC/PrrC, putative copper metallochaperone [uncultured Gammaproteobacteria bacteri